MCIKSIRENNSSESLSVMSSKVGEDTYVWVIILLYLQTSPYLLAEATGFVGFGTHDIINHHKKHWTTIYYFFCMGKR